MRREGNEEIDPEFVARLASYLGFDKERVQHLFEKNYLARNWGKYEYLLRFDKEISHIERGTVLYEKAASFETIMGFPKIRRAMVLDPTIKRHFSGLEKVAVEEKMNGYNVRIAIANNEILAITRSGYICPYTTQKAKEKLNLKFFDDFPGLVLYGEMIGPDNPYVSKEIYDIESVEFYIFDIREKNSGKPLPINRKQEILEKYGFFQVRFFNEFPLETAAEEVIKIIRKLGEEEHEGVVIKDPDMVLSPLKYTSSQSNCSDLRHAFKFYNETGRDYMLSRIVREGFQTVEWDEDEIEFGKRCMQLGESILNPLRRSIESVKNGQRLYEEARIKVRDLKTAAEFEDYLKRLGVDAVFEEPQPIEEEYLIIIRKINKSTNDKTQAILQGETW
ncbi:RNA ligase [Methanosarcina sp. MSH10X1]|uniref:RNA ligase n=1 Tax=Methanosarcina sp. MSH10X1 TaxID=2507075 RepID=UPI000FFBF5CD|nr:RNA ligase [Methanosarcina sp. MSH10X1]RXA18720.1 RNA ligase [Methanosarcina sp. MSH10X1]